MAGMYTKMTATGSSLIVAPRTISKELETKISAAIAGVIVKHDIATLTTKVVRQYVEKEVHVSLTNHKEVLKRLMHQEFRRIKAEKAAKRAAPQPWKIKARRQCIIKGLHQIYAQLRDDPNATDLSIHAMLTLYDLHAIDGFEVARVASTYMRMLAATWLQQQPQTAAGWPQGQVPTPSETLQHIAAVYTVERIGLSHPLRVELLEFLDRTPPVYTAKDYFGWDPSTAAPSANGATSAFRQMATTLLQFWFAHSLQLSLGFSLPQLLQHLPQFYPYKSPTEIGPDTYRDQVHMVTTLVLVLTNFGKLRCEPELLAHEYSFLRQHLVYCIVRQDLPLLGEMLRALRCFDGSDNLISVRRGMAVLMLSQQTDGSWKTLSGGASEDATKDKSNIHHTTMRAILALSEGRSHGYAPSAPDIVAMLEINLNADLPDVVLADETMHKDKKAKLAAMSAAAAAASATPAMDGPPAAAAAVRSSSSSPSPPPPVTSSTSSSTGTSTAAHVGGSEEESLEEQVRFHQSLLEKAGDNVKNVSAALAMQVLTTLSAMVLTVDILKSTGVGRTINKLRKHSSENVAKVATQLVAKWKKDLL